VQAAGLIQPLQTKDRPTKLARALEELGRLIKTLYLPRSIGHGFGDTSVTGATANQGSAAAWPALRGANTLTSCFDQQDPIDLATPVTLAEPVTVLARMFGDSGADLTAIPTPAPLAFSAGAGTVVTRVTRWASWSCRSAGPPLHL